MPEYLAPGVYVEEIELGAKPIEGVSTSTAGFLGETERGPTNPRLVTSWLQYQRLYGSYFGSEKYLPYAVEGFFKNGGQRCYIGRIAKSTATSAFLELKENANTLKVEAIGEGSWGNHITVKISKNTSNKLKLSVFYWKNPPTPLFDPETDLRSQPRPLTEIFNDFSLNESPEYFDTKINSISNFIKILKISSASAEAYDCKLICGATATGGTQNSIVLAADAEPDDAYNGMQIFIVDGTGRGQTRKIIDYSQNDNTATVDPNWKIIPDNTSKYNISWYVNLENGVGPIVLKGIARSGTTNTIELATDAKQADNVYNGMQIFILEGTGSGQTRKITAYNQNKTATVDTNWDINPDSKSEYVIIDSDLALSDYQRTDTNTPGQRKGLTAFAEIDEISIVYSPNAQIVSGLVDELIGHCEILKDRFAIIDSAKASSNISVIDPRSKNDTKYAAFYYPWVKVIDPGTGELRLIPPGGHISGIYARTDTERGVHKAPANEVVRGISELEFNIGKGEQDILNPRGVNCIRAFRSRGIRVWGGRTLSSDALWKYINVRRLFLYLEESIEEGTQWVVFEPNDEKLWARVKQTITQFLTRVWKDGALMGTTPEEAFFVKCDRTTMTQDDIDNGRLIVLIGVAPVKPAEFVIFRIAQWTGGSEVTE